MWGGDDISTIAADTTGAGIISIIGVTPFSKEGKRYKKNGYRGRKGEKIRKAK